MENLTPEGKAIYDMIKKASEAAHARCQKELDELIVAAVGRVVDKAVSAAVGTIVNDMQAYTEMPKRISSSRSRSFVQRRVSPPTVPPGRLRSAHQDSAGSCGDRPRWAPHVINSTGDGIGCICALHPSSGTRYHRTTPP